MKKIFYSLLFTLFIASPALASENFPTQNLIPLETKTITIQITDNTDTKNFSIPENLYEAPSVTLKKLITSRGKCTLQNFFISCKNLERGDAIILKARVRAEKLSLSEMVTNDPLVEFLVSQGEKRDQIISTPAPTPLSENFSLSHENKVLFTDGISIEREVKNADIKTFTEKKGTYAQDTKNFYYGEILVEKNFSHDFEYLGAGFSKKNNKIFIAEKIFKEVQEVKTFSPLKISENNWSQYSKDSKASYYQFTTTFSSDVQSLKAIGGNYAVDKDNIYFSGSKISTGPAEYLGEGKYGEYFAQDNGGFLLNGKRISDEILPRKFFMKVVNGAFGL